MLGCVSGKRRIPKEKMGRSSRKDQCPMVSMELGPAAVVLHGKNFGCLATSVLQHHSAVVEPPDADQRDSKCW